MKPEIRRRIEELGKRRGLDFFQACAELGRHSAAKRKAMLARRDRHQWNMERMRLA